MAYALSTFTKPDPQPVPPFNAKIAPPATHSRAHVAGEASGALAVYSDLRAFLWYVGGGWVTYNIRGFGYRAGLRGGEDVRGRSA